MNYLRLIKRFALRPIKADSQHEEAVKIMHELMHRGETNLNADELDYLSILADLVIAYENKTLEKHRQASPSQALKYLMEVNDLRQADLTHLVVKTNLSAFLSGARSLSKTEAARLGGYFRVAPALFLPKIEPLRSYARKAMMR